MYKYVGYVWSGMLRVTVEEARQLFAEGVIVYRLHLNNTESMISDVNEIDDNGEFGVECKKFDFDKYFTANADSFGAVTFSHGTDDIDDLLTLMKEFLEYIKQSIDDALKSKLETLVQGIDNYIDTKETDMKSNIWKEAETFLNDIIPPGWKFGAFANNGLDYVFVKENRIQDN